MLLKSLLVSPINEMLCNFYFHRNVPLGDCITPLPVTRADELLEQPDWRKRLEAVPRRFTESPNSDVLMFGKDRRRWRHRIRYYKEVRIVVLIRWKRYLVASCMILRFRPFIHDSLYMLHWWDKILLCSE